MDIDFKIRMVGAGEIADTMHGATSVTAVQEEFSRALRTPNNVIDLHADNVTYLVATNQVAYVALTASPT